MNAQGPFLTDPLKIDAGRETERIAAAIRENVAKQLKRKGVVLGLSGGIDSSVVAALSVRALGANRVFGLFMPEADSSGESLRLGRLVADYLGIKTALEEITPVLKATGCYQRRDDAIRTVIPEYDSAYKCKIVLPNILENKGYPVFSVVVQSPTGELSKTRLTAEAYLSIVAASNFKQRVRKMMEYYHADRLNYAVIGTPNRLEYDQGFFVKNGDGSADLKPIAHLYKTQVYRLAEYLGIPSEIQKRLPTTDTYSLQQSQEEFYFSLPYDKMDLCLFGKNHNIPASQIAELSGLTDQQIERVYQDIESKRTATRYLQMNPLLVEKISEISH
jgi:NAD+ synthase